MLIYTMVHRDTYIYYGSQGYLYIIWFTGMLIYTMVHRDAYIYNMVHRDTYI